MAHYYFYIDESGDHSLRNVDPAFPYFVLCGCLLRGDENKKLETNTLQLKATFFGSKNVILHSRDIRKCEKEFQILLDLEVKKKFYTQLNNLIDTTDFTIISAGIKKEEYIKKYGMTAHNPYDISLSFILERLIFCLDGLDQYSTVGIYAESRGKNEDANLLAHFNTIRDRGSYYVEASRFQSRIISLEFCKKSANDSGIQLADLCAYPLARSIISPGNIYEPINIIQGKIYKKSGQNYGLKIFP